VTSETVVGDGFGEQADKGVFIIGPTGLALGQKGDLYVSDALGDRIAAIPDALTRTTSAGTGATVTSGGLLQRPLALAIAPNGHLLTTNGLNGQVVEIDPAAGKQLSAQWIDADKAQQPAGNGDLFGIAMSPDGQGFYYVEDDVNTLVLAN
jgi:sugar lactone lactonase YvrE